MNYLKSYENEAAYLADATEARMKSGDFLLPNVSFVQDTKAVHYNKYREFPPEFGDIYINDATTNTNRFVSSTEYFNNLVSDSNITPIGIVVIPASFTDDNKTRVMALLYASDTLTPTTTTVQFKWGYEDTIATSYKKVINDTGTALASSGYLPDEDGTYGSGTHLPSPYTSSGDKNPIYFYNTVINSVDFSPNALADMDGEGNTDDIISRVTVADWQTKEKIRYDLNTAGSYPAAMVCRRYITVGTNRGDWYLPSIGELGFINVKRHTINNILTNFINNNIDVSKISLNYETVMVFSSTECGKRYWCLDYGNYQRQVKTNTKSSSYGYVRPFLKV